MSEDDWIKALEFAALPGAVRVEFSRSVGAEDGTPTVNYVLTSYDADGQKIGDDRDYDVLKAAMGPLERLSEARGEETFEVMLDLKTAELAFSAG